MPSCTNIFSTISTPAKASNTNLVNIVSLPVRTASRHEGLSLSDPTNPEEDDSEIPPFEDIYQNSTDGIFTNSSYDDEGAVADFTNLETVVNGKIVGKDKLKIHIRWLTLYQKLDGAKGLTSPEKMATGKDISNPFMAVVVCQKPYGIQLISVSRTES
ncbi:hypothetical protein Tco_0427986 [Tanacetum coccineum]